MPHVFQAEEGKFIQVHTHKLDQLSSLKIKKRQRNSEYIKFLLGLEADATQRSDARIARKEAMSGSKDD